MNRSLPYVVAAVVAAGLVALSSTGTLAAVAAVVLAVLCSSLVVLGPERLGTGFIVLAMFTAPENSVRPVASANFVTFSDLFLATGFALLFPVLLRRRARFPIGFLVGAALLVVAVALASLLSPDPLLAFNPGARLIAAVVALPFVFLLWRPPATTIDLLAWSYVGGHVVSTGYAVVEGSAGNNRYDGLTTHYNFFGLSALMATCLLIYLFGRTPPRRRWVVWAAGAVCLASVAMSGSRAAALVLLMIALLYPLIERSLISAYLLVAAALTFVVAGDRLLALASGTSLVDRLQGDATTSNSDEVRGSALTVGFAKFLTHPLLGNGFDSNPLAAHNIYLQVAVGVGVFGLVAYLVVLWAAVKTLFGTSELRRLGYVPLAYVAVGLISNSLWDRFVWMAVSLAFLAAVDQTQRRGPAPANDEVGTGDPEQPLRVVLTSATAGLKRGN